MRSLTASLILIAIVAASLAGYREWEVYQLKQLRTTRVFYPVAPLFFNEKPGVQVDPKPLIDEITSSIQPRTWEQSGGMGRINFFTLSHALIVRNNSVAQEAIARLIETKQVETLTTMLRSGENLPAALLELFRVRGIDRDRTAMATLRPDFAGMQGKLIGTLVTDGGELIEFDIDFIGEDPRDRASWGRIVAVNQWEVSRVANGSPESGGPVKVAMRMMKEGQW